MEINQLNELRSGLLISNHIESFKIITSVIKGKELWLTIEFVNRLVGAIYFIKLNCWNKLGKKSSSIKNTDVVKM